MVDESNIPSNGILEVKLDYIQKAVTSIQIDVKDIKNDYISRREFTEALSAVRREFEEQVSPVRKFVYGIISVLGVAVLGGLINLLINKQ